MVRRKKASVFEEDDVNDDGDEFAKYVQEKSAQSRKRTKQDVAGTRNVIDQLVNKADPACSNMLTLGSKYMTKILDSKKQRELDRLHAQSLKMQLERRLEGDAGEQIITESYVQKKEIYEKADLLAEQESYKEDKEKQNAVIGERGVAMRMLISEEEPNSSPESPLELNTEKHEKFDTTFGNDVYVNETIKPTSEHEVTREDLDLSQKQILVKTFLKSNKTAQQIEFLIKQYWERQNGH
ncbi:ZYBA0S07-04632g1_1 [Zygosaccharomyces bailii CLIB 213]|uniref:ZYBA0S07-04632g1_1 n=1 Tax=Zygosaccharomyces bailii (strain CLIB 213 / ATCC 58445 / CBS 680 / BCRC 21525 / NBRC 1098 / NCYC 1416 / NRRL Y-2227) TaxID=1333698 RepID=A0A8J2T971_ZYGB2|nr:ZYBA0S07-04632g1_1 [Zygosaccharomyces bailii CLIB 213]